MQKIHLHLGALAALAISIIGCGGGGGAAGPSGSNGTGTVIGPSAAGLTKMTVSVSLPTGVKVPSGGLRLSGGKFDPVTVTGTSATITSWGRDRQLVAAIDSQNNPVLIGFVSPGHTTLNAASTAVALAYFGIAGYTAPYETTETNIETLEGDSNVAGAASAIVTSLQSDGNLSNPSASYRSAISTVAGDLLGAHGSSPNAKVGNFMKIAHPAALTITPTLTAKSGVTVAYASGSSQILANNTFRRRVLLFVDQSSTTDVTGATTKNWVPVSATEVAPAKGTVGAFDLIGNLEGYAPVTSTGSLTVPPLTTGLQATDYTVTAAGPGSNSTASPTLTSLEQGQLLNFLDKSFIKDFFLPLFNVMLANAATNIQIQQTPIYAALENTVDGQSSSVQSFVTANFPSTVKKMDSGDFAGALNDLINQLKTNPTVLAPFYASLSSSTSGIPGVASSSRLTTICAWMSKAIASPSTNGILLPQETDVSNSNTFDTWDVQVNQAQVSLTPLNATVSNTVPSQLTATLTANVKAPGGLPADSTLSYSWTTSGVHGDITPNGAATGGNSFPNSSSDFVTYGAITGLTASTGTDTVQVEVTETDKNGTVTKLGGAQVTVNVTGEGQVTLAPQNVSVVPDATSSAVVAQISSTTSIGTGAGDYQFQWSLSPASLGTLDVGTGATTQQQVTIAAGANQGNGVLTCNLVDSTRRVSATSTCNVRVEKQPTIVHGTIHYGTHDITSSMRTSWGIWVKFPVVAGAKTVSMHCYNFDDRAFWGTSINLSGTSPDGGKTWNWQGGDDISPEGVDSGPAGSDGNLYFGLTGGQGPSPGDPAGVAAAMNSRFGGMIIEATFGY